MESSRNTYNRILLKDALREALPSDKVKGMCCWMEAQFLDWIEYNRVAMQESY